MNTNTQPLLLQVKNSNTGVHSQRVAFKLDLLSEVYSFCYLCLGLRISDEVFVRITSQLEVHLSLHFLCVQVYQVWTWLSGVPQNAGSMHI